MGTTIGLIKGDIWSLDFSSGGTGMAPYVRGLGFGI